MRLLNPFIDHLNRAVVAPFTPVADFCKTSYKFVKYCNTYDDALKNGEAWIGAVLRIALGVSSFFAIRFLSRKGEFYGELCGRIIGDALTLRYSNFLVKQIGGYIKKFGPFMGNLSLSVLFEGISFSIDKKTTLLAMTTLSIGDISKSLKMSIFEKRIPSLSALFAFSSLIRNQNEEQESQTQESTLASTNKPQRMTLNDYKKIKDNHPEGEKLTCDEIKKIYTENKQSPQNDFKGRYIEYLARKVAPHLVALLGYKPPVISPSRSP